MVYLDAVQNRKILSQKVLTIFDANAREVLAL